MASMLAFQNHVDKGSVTITASPAALGELPVTNLKVPWFDGIARGASAAYTFSLSWEQSTADLTDLVALLGVNWRSRFSVDLRWWNSGQSWAAPAGSTTQSFYYVGLGAPWIGYQPRNIYVPLSARTQAAYWRMDVTLGYSGDGSAWAWECRRLWSSPALRFAVRSPMRTLYLGTQAVAISETAIPSVSSGQTYRRLSFGGRALTQGEVYATISGQHSLNQLMYDKGVDSEAILLPRIESTTGANQVQLMGVYGRLLSQLEVVQLKGSRFDINGEIQEVPSPLPSPLVAPT